jgi:hypothetical protein
LDAPLDALRFVAPSGAGMLTMLLPQPGNSFLDLPALLHQPIGHTFAGARRLGTITLAARRRDRTVSFPALGRGSIAFATIGRRPISFAAISFSRRRTITVAFAALIFAASIGAGVRATPLAKRSGGSIVFLLRFVGHSGRAAGKHGSQ